MVREFRNQNGESEQFSGKWKKNEKRNRLFFFDACAPVVCKCVHWMHVCHECGGRVCVVTGDRNERKEMRENGDGKELLRKMCIVVNQMRGHRDGRVVHKEHVDRAVVNLVRGRAFWFVWIFDRITIMKNSVTVKDVTRAWHVGRIIYADDLIAFPFSLPWVSHAYTFCISWKINCNSCSVSEMVGNANCKWTFPWVVRWNSL